MKKNVWMKLILLFVAGCLLTGDSPGTAQDSTSILPTIFAGTPSAPAQIYSTQTVLPGLTELDQVENTGHFTIHYPLEEQESAGYIGIVLEDNLERVCTDLAHCPQQKIEVFIYADLETFHQAIGYPDAPEWVVAAGLDGKIRMVTPRLITSDLADKGAVHELVHVLQSEVNTDAPVWMNEGIAMYEAGQSEGVSEIVVKGVQEDNIPPLDVLDTQDTEAFAQAGGYAYAYTVVEFAVQTYGKDILAEWVKTPRDYQRVFGVTKETFEKQWMDQLLELYSP